jgi:hypothetical protein
MHRFGWIIIAIGALLLFGKGGFFLLPLFFFWPLLLALPFLLMGRRMRGYGPGWGGRGLRSYYWRGRHGYYGQPGGCGPERREPPAELRERQAGDGGAYTGQTTRL